MNIANALTMSRIFFAAIIFGLLALNVFWGHVLGFVLFVVAALTDAYDGMLARKYNLITDWGKILDPIADKVLILSVFIAFVLLGMVSAWMVVMIALREIAVTVDRLWLIKHGKVMAAERAGKIKTVLQMMTIMIIFLYLIAQQWDWLGHLFFQWQQAWLNLIHVLMVMVVFVTIGSGAAYYKMRIKGLKHG